MSAILFKDLYYVWITNLEWNKIWQLNKSTKYKANHILSQIKLTNKIWIDHKWDLKKNQSNIELIKSHLKWNKRNQT